MPPADTRQKLECPSCGAPLRWKGEAPVVACRYCDAHVHTPTGRATQEPAVVRSEGGRSAGCGVVAGIVGINLIIGVIVLVVALATEGPGTLVGVPLDALVALDIHADNATIAKALGLPPDEEGDDLHIPLRGSDFDYAFLRWDDKHPDHVASFGLYATDGHPRRAELVTALEGYLGRRLERTDDGSRSWRWAGGTATVSADGSHFGYYGQPEGDPYWDYRARLLWSVLTAVAAGQPLELQPSTRRAWLAQGYELGDLAALDLAVDVDRASAAMQAAFPGAHTEVFIGLDVEVPLAHPWFGVAELSWPNEPGGRLASADFRPPPGQQTFPDQQPIRTCLDKALGQGETRVDDHLAGTWSTTWELADSTWLHLSRYALAIHRDRSHGAARPGPASWRRVLLALEACSPA